jgi:hypothetical protein
MLKLFQGSDFVLDSTSFENFFGYIGKIQLLCAEAGQIANQIDKEIKKTPQLSIFNLDPFHPSIPSHLIV